MEEEKEEVEEEGEDELVKAEKMKMEADVVKTGKERTNLRDFFMP